MDRIKAELSDGPSPPANDTDTDSVGNYLSLAARLRNTQPV